MMRRPRKLIVVKKPLTKKDGFSFIDFADVFIDIVDFLSDLLLLIYDGPFYDKER